MKSLAFLVFVFVASVGSPLIAQEKVDAAEILARVDRVATQAADFTARVELVTVDAKGTETPRSLTVWQKGNERRMLKITKPARLKGVGMLATSPDELYMYLPAFGRARRVAGQKRGQPFLGSNFTQDDMVRTAYEPRFTPTLTGEDDETWTLRLDPKKPKNEPHHHLVVTVRKSDAIIAAIDYHDGDGSKPSRRLEATEIRDVGKTRIAHRITVVNHADQSRSTLVLDDVKVDTGLDDSLFSKRHLTRKP